ncbi:MAG: GNAT family N-acetyltransferase [Methanospirillum sp.]|nr:GNAT family N-acetyltransferase [Methanospirillum sp.]
MQGQDACPEDILYTVHDRDEIDAIEPLWYLLSAHHREEARSNARAFVEEMEARSFAARRDELLGKNRDRALRIEIARDRASGRAVGYCVASGVSGGHGEVESIFVDEAYRNRGVGGALLEHAAAWMDGLGTVEQILSVFSGNGSVLPFYARHGFSPRFVVLVRRVPGP